MGFLRTPAGPSVRTGGPASYEKAMQTSKRPWASLPIATAAAIALSAFCLRAADDVTFTSLLAEMVDRTVVTHPPVHPYRTLEASSYDRASATPSDPAGWFANGDSNRV
jgi:hypothetical protein